MAQTQAILEIHLPPVLAALAHAYLMPNDPRNSYNIALLGHGELCLTLKRKNLGLGGACEGGHLALVELMISRGANDWNWGLGCACEGGHLVIAELMISRGANNWNWGLEGACKSGHFALAKMMIIHGATTCGVCDKTTTNHLTA